MIPSSDSDEEIDRQSSVHPAIRITVLPEDSLEEENMSDLKALKRNRGKKAEPKGTGTSQPVVSLPPPPLQVPDPGLKPIQDLKKKRPLEIDEREVVVPPRQPSSRRWRETTGAKGPHLLKAGMSLLLLMYTEGHAHGLPS